ncbi:MAG: hypothetical protein GY760_15435 [Deltaproteobacteria bacterium]|nr:hypothetical protein [Deltaproteobacteria bacterium]
MGKYYNSFYFKKMHWIGFDTIIKKEDIVKVDCFKDWQPEYLSQVETNITLSNQYSEVSDIKHFSMFKFEEEIRYRLLYANFEEWNKGDEEFCADQLFFFENERLFLFTVPYELIIMFCNLKDDELDLLKTLDQNIIENLSQSPTRYVKSRIL